MFTGIIEEIGTLKAISHGQRSATLEISALKVLEGSRVGDSIAVNGICLTVTSIGKGSFIVDAMPETLGRSNLGSLQTGSKINLERALRLGDRLGGHLVSGHIDGEGIIFSFREDDNAIRIRITANQSLLRYIIEKGSVAVDGISLTVTHVDDKSFEVSVIPHTKNETTLCGKRPGERVNLETDMIGKYIERFSGFSADPQIKESKDISIDFLKENGYF
ncbi:MAG: riboflavin synthase [Lentimicrobiaceae bacterium]|nr:riboflavin synthase [Lentimicrobiaceae bacterium]